MDSMRVLDALSSPGLGLFSFRVGPARRGTSLCFPGLSSSNPATGISGEGSEGPLSPPRDCFRDNEPPSLRNDSDRASPGTHRRDT